MKYITTIFFIISCYLSAAAQDTLYVKFMNDEAAKILEGFKHEMDTLDIYPFNGGRIYLISKKVVNFNNDISFSYHSYTPEWMDQQFEYKIIDKSFLKKKDFKDVSWFEKTDYYEILKIFNGNDKVIYLVDEDQIKNKNKIYMVRVYFSHTAEE